MDCSRETSQPRPVTNQPRQRASIGFCQRSVSICALPGSIILERQYSVLLDAKWYNSPSCYKFQFGFAGPAAGSFLLFPLRPESVDLRYGGFTVGLELLCMMVIGLGFGFVLAFWGYRLLWVILPIWGFFAGFALGAQTIDIITGNGFLGDITGLVVGFVVGAIFAILSYLFYFLAVALLSGAFGYGLAVGILTWIGLDLNFLVWIIGIVVGVAVAVLVLRFNIQKYAVILITAFAGTAVTIFVMLAAFGGLTPVELMLAPVVRAIDDSWLWFLYFIVVAAAGIFFQLQTNQEYEVEEYNRWATE